MQTSTCPMAWLWALILATFAYPACAQLGRGPPAASPPKHLALDTESSAGVEALGYFTPAEEADATWEARRLAMVLVTNGRTKPRVISRDVHWFPAAEPAGPPCARIIYTLDTGEPRNQSARWAQRREATRVGLVAAEPISPIEPGCGIKDRDKLPKLSSDDYYRRFAERPARYRKVDVQCEWIAVDPSTPIRIFPNTRLWETAAFDGRLPFTQNDEATAGRADWPSGIISRRLYAAALPDLPIVKLGDLPNDGHNILIFQHVARWNDGRGYCVQLMARQGDRVWSRAVVRNDMMNQNREKQDDTGFSRDPLNYWTPETDLFVLADQLASSIGIPRKVEVPEGWGS